MNNEEALVTLEAKRDSLNGAINELTRFVREQGDWKLAVKTTQLGNIKRLSSAGGVDLSACNGKGAPVE